MSSAARKPLKFPSRGSKAKPDSREHCHSEFLTHIAAGRSIGDACSLIGITRSNYENWRARVSGFKARVEAAREQHRREVASGLHTAEAYSRMLMDAIQRDEALPAALRYRAAKSILNRPGKKDWLPEPLPAGSPTLDVGFEEPAPEQQANPEQQTNPSATAAVPADPLNPLTEIAQSEATESLPIQELSATQTAPSSTVQFSSDPLAHTAEIPLPEAVRIAPAACTSSSRQFPYGISPTRH